MKMRDILEEHYKLLYESPVYSGRDWSTILHDIYEENKHDLTRHYFIGDVVWHADKAEFLSNLKEPTWKTLMRQMIPFAMCYTRFDKVDDKGLLCLRIEFDPELGKYIAAFYQERYGGNQLSELKNVYILDELTIGK